MLYNIYEPKAEALDMTKFTKENLHKDGPYVHYRPAGGSYKDEKFVARFKVGGIGSFMTHLRKNWTVEDFFAERDAGKSPLDIAKSTGYLLPHIKKWLKQDGYPTTKAGHDAWFKEVYMPKFDANHA
jgi:hypothetical protein